MEKGAKLVQHVSPMAPGRPTEKLNIYQKKEPVNRFDSRRDELHTARKATEDKSERKRTSWRYERRDECFWFLFVRLFLLLSSSVPVVWAREKVA